MGEQVPPGAKGALGGGTKGLSEEGGGVCGGGGRGIQERRGVWRIPAASLLMMKTSLKGPANGRAGASGGG